MSSEMTALDGLSEESAGFIETALSNPDKTHHELRGFPDDVKGASTVRTTVVTRTISKPVAITDIWDLHIVGLPWFEPVTCDNFTMTSGNRVNLDQTPPYTNNISYGGVFAASMEPGMNPFPVEGVSGIVEPKEHYAMTLPTTFVRRHQLKRYVSSRVKVTYTGPPITAQGALVQWTMPTAPVTTTIFEVDSFANNIIDTVWPLPFKQYPMPPGDRASAMRTLDSRTDRAENGALNVARLNLDGINPYYESPHGVLLRGPIDPNSDLAIGIYGNNGFVRATGAFLENGFASPTAFDMHGIILTGLNADATFEIEWTVVVEHFPDVNDSGTLAYARRSPPFDPDVLKLYANTIRTLTPFWSAADNAHGDYWKAALKTVKIVTATDRIARAIGAPSLPKPFRNLLKGNQKLLRGEVEQMGGNKSNATTGRKTTEKAPRTRVTVRPSAQNKGSASKPKVGATKLKKA